MDEKEFKENYYMYEYYKEKMKEMMKEKAEVDETLMKLRISLDAIKVLKSKEKGARMFVPVGSSAFVPVSLESKSVLVGIGANIAISVEPEEAERILRERMQNIEKMSREFNQAIVEMRKEIDSLAGKLQKYVDDNPGKFS